MWLMVNALIVLTYILVLVAIAVSNLRARKRNCPDCGHRLPAYQPPWSRTTRQLVEGGYLCPNCGCETDLRGNKVEGGARTAVFRFAILALVGIVLTAVSVYYISHPPSLLVPPALPPEAVKESPIPK